MDPKTELVPGEHYFSVFCVKCRQLIPLFHDPSKGHIKFSGQGKLQLTCPHCGKSQKHPARTAVSRKLEIQPATKH
jgi:RNase P subunit RPR2